MPLRSIVFQKDRRLQLSIPHPSSAPSISHKSVCTSLNPSCSVSSLLWSCLYSSHQLTCMSVCLARLFPSASSALPSSSIGRPPDRLPLCFSACLNFICSAQNFLHSQTSGSSYGALGPSLLLAPQCFLPFFGCHL